MKKKYLLTIILSILGLALLSTVTFASDFRFTKNFPSHTFIGPFNISGLTMNEAKSKLVEKVTELRDEMDVQVAYLDQTIAVPSEIVEFDIERSIEDAGPGKDNPLVATVSEDGLQTLLDQQISQIIFSGESISLIARGIESELKTGIMPVKAHLLNYVDVSDIPTMEVATSNYTIEYISPSLQKAISNLNDMTIHPAETFSMMDVLKNEELDSLSDEEMTILSSLLYKAVLQTNFQVDERNISKNVALGIVAGFEAAVNQSLGLDFKFTNPNKSDFTIHANWFDGKIQLSISGPPFYYTYEPVIERIDTYKPRTIRQYSAFVKDGQVLVSEEGKEGGEVVVQRTISHNGKLVNTEDISKDFYAPVHRIEMYPLTKADSSTNEPTGENENGSYENGSIENGTEQIEEGESGAGSDSSTVNGSVSSTDSNKNETESQNEGKQIYDKSGLPIGSK